MSLRPLTTFLLKPPHVPTRPMIKDILKHNKRVINPLKQLQPNPSRYRAMHKEVSSFFRIDFTQRTRKHLRGGRAFLLLRLNRVGIRSSKTLHESATTLDGAGLFQSWVNTFSSTLQLFSVIHLSSNFAYNDLTVKIPSSSIFHTQTSAPVDHT